MQVTLVRIQCPEINYKGSSLKTKQKKKYTMTKEKQNPTANDAFERPAKQHGQAYPAPSPHTAPPQQEKLKAQREFCKTLRRSD